MLMKKIFFLTCMMLSVALTFAQNTKKVAILQPVDKEGNVAYGHKLMLRSNLAKAVAATPGYEAYDRTDLDAIMSEQDFQRTGMVNEDQIKRLGEMTGAAYVLVSEAVKIDETNMFITAKILNVETAKTEISDNELMGTSAAEIQNGCISLAHKLFGTSMATQPKVVNTPSSTTKQAPASTPPAPANTTPVVRNADEYVNLGLASGTLWRAGNENCGLITYEQAMSRYGSNLPTKEQWEELVNSCTWTWTGDGYNVTGPNNETIYFHAYGYNINNGKTNNKMGEGDRGDYWSSTLGRKEPLSKSMAKLFKTEFIEYIYGLEFSKKKGYSVAEFPNCIGMTILSASVRLVK